ncbi:MULTISPECIES: type II toxin-antitoxin system RelE/ParE family toxin [unclassified Okeania]|uniref:type II toxin-antitoxin system RelE family toxin n=1 Tax=unclassified Okeania TaxID=2634635 RepID=UPI00257E04F3|nr:MULTISPECIES: type II toxin-antitoxin system RelE/ParE family toxin [unclassified Okeania]
MSEWNLIILKAAENYLKPLPLPDQERILRGLKLLKTDRTMIDIKPLKGRPEWRLRVGKYRVLFIEDQENLAYIVTVIGPRGDVYK